ncbi:hypothetical protein ACFYWX_25520 [Streptomyces sp. NPDC002888]|uniref:hypothetical protein n=1 Tax=Streptomyces sp. NPDC002888 TaxID=3364668 RepID=UPI00368BA22E
MLSGIAVPGDISVGGFDDSHLARLAHIDLTTVGQDIPPPRRARRRPGRRTSGGRQDPGRGTRRRPPPRRPGNDRPARLNPGFGYPCMPLGASRGSKWSTKLFDKVDPLREGHRPGVPPSLQLKALHIPHVGPPHSHQPRFSYLLVRTVNGARGADPSGPLRVRRSSSVKQGL